LGVKIPTGTVQALLHEITSDHTPLLLSFEDTRGASQPIFIFELGWLTRVDFWEVVERSWKSDCEENTALYIWQNKIRRLRQFLRCLCKNKSGHYRKEKKELISKLDMLDKKAETQTLHQWEVDLKQTPKSRLIQLLREEEIKW